MKGFLEKVISDLGLEGWVGVYQTYDLGKEHSRKTRLGVLFFFLLLVRKETVIYES